MLMAMATFQASLKTLSTAQVALRELAQLSQLRTFFGFFAMNFIVKSCVCFVGL